MSNNDIASIRIDQLATITGGRNRHGFSEPASSAEFDRFNNRGLCDMGYDPACRPAKR